MVPIYKTPPSLRKRYLKTTLFIGFIVVFIVAISYLNILSTKQAVTNAYQGVLEEQSKIDETRNNLLSINKDINLFLLDPINEDLLHKIDTNTNSSINLLKTLLKSEHEFHIPLTQKVLPLLEKFKSLNIEVKRLVEYRKDINKQYPAMDISANEMEIQQDKINSGFEILKREIESESLTPTSEQLYPELIKTHLNWIKAISQTRIYMTNRLASFSIEILKDQGKSLNDFHDIFMQSLKKLKKLYQNEDSFEAEEILNSIEKLSQKWLVNFLIMREISEHGEWRSDTMIMKNRIFPVMKTITLDLNLLETTLRTEKQNIDHQLQKSDTFFYYLIFGLITLLFLFIGFILISLDWMVFSPIRQISQALKSKAIDISSPEIGAAKTLEIANLLDAYQQMDQEVTERQKALEHQAMHDHLTGLPNRFALSQRLEYQLLSGDRENGQFILCFMDLDYFKEINDTLGHSAGDQLLIKVSNRIQSLIRKSDTLARLGGDEFALLLPKTDPDNAKQLVRKIIESLEQPFIVDNESINVGLSIGMAVYPKDSQNAENLLQYADMAMYAAKRQRASFSFYDSNENIYSKERMLLTQDLVNAIEAEQLEAYYQPKIELKNQKIVACEALLRWNHPTLGFISPEKVIDAAERIGVIHKLTLQILNKAISECAQWHKQGYKISVAVNLSVTDLANEELSFEIKNLLDQNKLEYRYLILEITESVMMENLNLSLIQLNQLNQLGIKISIDDFGTGFSSLAYLKRLPVNELKIDKSFIQEINQDQNDLAIVHSTIDLGHNLGLTVTAEGVENEQTIEILNELNCDLVQGYFISRPVDSDSFRIFLRESVK